MKNKPTVSAVIVAAGSGTRMGGVSKPLIDLGGKTVLERVLDAVSAAETVDDIVLVCHVVKNRSKRSKAARHARNP